MPIIVNAASAGLKRIRIGALPYFNAEDPNFVVTTFTGWYSARPGVPTLVANGGGPGAVALREEPGEAFYTLAGAVETEDYAAFEVIRQMLIDGLMGGERAVGVLDGRVGIDKQIFVHAYDTPEVDVYETVLEFSFPLVAPDPYKYALEPLVGDVGAFVSQQWFRNYVDDATAWVRSYSLAGGSWSREYVQAVPDGPYPTSLTLTSPGDASSRRVTITVSGPLTAGDWRLRNESTGEELWVDLSVSEGQTLVVDSAARSARLNGEDVGHLVFGEYLSLAPGDNLFRLATGTSTDAHAFVSALPAYL